MRFWSACALLMAVCGCGMAKVEDSRAVASLPPIYPDYTGVTVPATIAPLNFCADTAGVQTLDVVIKGGRGGELHVQGGDAVDIPADEWSVLLAANKGDSLTVTVSMLMPDGWISYNPFPVYVSADDIDYGIVYRLVAPGYEKYGHMGIYERPLSDFSEHMVFDNNRVDGCVNCHSFKQCDPSLMSMHVRGPHGGTLLRRPSGTEVWDTKVADAVSACVYPYWHPSGDYIAYSTNLTAQVVHTSPGKVVEVFDEASDVNIVEAATGRLISPPACCSDSVWETFPAFSPDGRTLYFCAAAALTLPDSLKQVRYDLCCVSFDPATGMAGAKVDTLVHASATGRSVAFPRPSYDGRHLVYTLSDYGTFPIWHKEADLWILDLATGQTRPLDGVNSPDTESYHSFSGNSRWLVFSSRRDDGLYTRPYIAHIAEDGTASKAFMLPQRDPRDFYDSRYYSYNIPEFVSAPVDLDKDAAADMLNSPGRRKFSGPAR